MVNFGLHDYRRRAVGIKSGRALPALLIALGLSACASGDIGSDAINDPLEPANRAVHSLNKGLDTAILRPASRVYGAVTPDGLERGVANAMTNLGHPGDVINHTLQGDLPAAVRTTGRFLVNTTFGVAGFFDAATQMGLPMETSDFGETLYVWGLAEGAYLELPALGPSTVRDATGRLVDTVLDPVQVFASGDTRDTLLGTSAVGLVNTRHRLRGVIDPTYYDSVDSYSAARIGYLQNRRAALKGETDVEDLEDPFAFE